MLLPEERRGRARLAPPASSTRALRRPAHMLDRHDVLDSMLREIRITRHLVEKVPPGGMDLRPTPGQRSTLELLRYQSFCGLGGTHAMLDGGWERYQALAAAADGLGPDEIPGALDAQAAALEEVFGTITDEAFDTQEATSPRGEVMTLGKALLEHPVKWLVAYKLQLFLHCKMAGNDDIWTPNCWGGVDMARPETQS